MDIEFKRRLIRHLNDALRIHMATRDNERRKAEPDDLRLMALDHIIADAEDILRRLNESNS